MSKPLNEADHIALLTSIARDVESAGKNVDATNSMLASFAPVVATHETRLKKAEAAVGCLAKVVLALVVAVIALAIVVL